MLLIIYKCLCVFIGVYHWLDLEEEEEKACEKKEFAKNNIFT